MKIVFLDRKTLGDSLDYSELKKLGDVHFYETTLLDEEINERIKDADIVITNKVRLMKNSLSQARRLKLICIAATGMNNIDTEYARSKGVSVLNVKGYSTESVVQHSFSMLFNIIGRTHKYIDYVKRGQWHQSDIFTHLDYPFMEIANKSWGIVGLGEIGSRVAAVASSFGCNVSYFSTSGLNRNESFNQVKLDTLLKQSDIISIHAPLNNKTFDLISYNELELLKENAIVLNLGRGGIINEEDIAKILKVKNVIFGLDVLNDEPISLESPLNKVINDERVFISPHIAWSSIEARKRLLEGIISNISKFLNS